MGWADKQGREIWRESDGEGKEGRERDGEGKEGRERDGEGKGKGEGKEGWEKVWLEKGGTHLPTPKKEGQQMRVLRSFGLV